MAMAVTVIQATSAWASSVADGEAMDMASTVVVGDGMGVMAGAVDTGIAAASAAASAEAAVLSPAAMAGWEVRPLGIANIDDPSASYRWPTILIEADRKQSSRFLSWVGL